MDMKVWTMLGLRIAAILFSDRGMDREAAMANGLLRAWQAGRNVDAEMARFADLLGTEDEPAMEDLIAVLNSETDEFLSRGPDGQLPET